VPNIVDVVWSLRNSATTRSETYNVLEPPVQSFINESVNNNHKAVTVRPISTQTGLAIQNPTKYGVKSKR